MVRVMRKEAQRVGRLSRTVDIPKAYDLIFPEFDHEDNQEMGTAISYLMQGLTAARGAGWISNETAMKVLFKFCELEIDINEEADRIAAEQGQQRARTTRAPGIKRTEPGQVHGPDETQQPRESPELAGKIKGNTLSASKPALPGASLKRASWTKRSSPCRPCWPA